MATPHEEFFRLVREIRDTLVKKDQSVVAIPRSSKTVVDFTNLTASLNNLLSELQTQTTTLSTLALQSAVDGIEALLATIDADTGAMVVDLDAIETLITAGNVDLAALETLLTASNVDLAAIETLITAGNVDLAALEVLITTANADIAQIDTTLSIANSNRAANQTANQTDFDAMVTDLAAIEVLITAGNVDLAAIEALLITIDADTGNIGAQNLEATQQDLKTQLVAANVDLAAIEALITTANSNRASNQTANQTDFDAIVVDLAAMEVLLAAIDANTDPSGGSSALVSGGSTVAASMISGGLSVAGALVSGGASVLVATSSGDILADIAEDMRTVLENATGDVLIGAVASGDTTFTIRPSTGQRVAIESLQIFNNHATLTRVFEFFWSDGTNHVPMLPATVSITSQNKAMIGSSFHNSHVQRYILTRNKFLRVVADGAADANEFDITCAFETLVGTNAPTFTSIA